MFSPCWIIEARKAPTISLSLKCLRVGQDVFKHFRQLGLAWVVKRRSSYLPKLGSNPTCDMFALNGLIGIDKLPIISLSLKCLIGGEDISKHF